MLDRQSRCRLASVTWEVDAMTDHEAFEEGYDAYWDGADVSDNPHKEEKDADARRSWDEGWRAARKHDYDESDG